MAAIMEAVLTCTSLSDSVKLVMERTGKQYPVYTLDRLLHVSPEKMKEEAEKKLEEIPPEYDTVLIAMGFCGGVWDHVTAPRRLVVPRVDDCVSLLLSVDDEWIPNRKETGHLYLYETDPSQFSARALMKDYSMEDPLFAGMDREWLFHMWFDAYHHLDIIDTGLNPECYSEEYAEKAQENADQIGAVLDYVQGSCRMLEKLLTGKWDQQFIIKEKGTCIRHADFF